MFSEEQKRHMQTRANLDRIEAESEIVAANDPSVYKTSFSEGARQDLERLADYLSQPPSKLFADSDRREALRFASLLTTLEKLAVTNPAALECAAFTNFFPADPLRHLTAYITDGEGTIHTVCQIVTDDRWQEQIEKLAQKPDVIEFDLQMERLEALASTPVHTQWVTVPAATLSPELVELGLRSWMEKYFPRFSDIEMNWLVEADRPEFGRSLMKQSLKRRIIEDPGILDRLLERIQPDTDDSV